MHGAAACCEHERASTCMCMRVASTHAACVQRAQSTRTRTCTCGVACTQCLHEEYIDVAVRALEDLEGVRVLLAVERVAPAPARADVSRATTRRGAHLLLELLPLARGRYRGDAGEMQGRCAHICCWSCCHLPEGETRLTMCTRMASKIACRCGRDTGRYRGDIGEMCTVMASEIAWRSW